MPRKEFKLSNFVGFDESNIKHYIRDVDGDIKSIFRFIQIKRTRSIVLTADDFRAGATPPTDTTIGTTPTMAADQYNATGELSSIYIHMPKDWDKDSDCTFDLAVSLRANETTADELSWTLDYVAAKKNTTAAGLAKTSSSTTNATTVTTANGLATGDMYVSSFTLSKTDTNNGFGFGDKVIGFGLEFHLTNVTEVADIDVVGGALNYTSLY